MMAAFTEVPPTDVARASLPASSLYRHAHLPESVQSSEDLEPLEGLAGQERALAALRFGLGMHREGFNVFALGPSGLGKLTVIRHLARTRAEHEPTPPDWVYVNHFGQPHQPRAIAVPAGRGAPFGADMQALVEELQATIPAAFEGESYRSRRQAMDEEFKAREERAFHELETLAKAHNISIVRTPMGVGLTPIRNGEPIANDDYQDLPDTEREQIQADVGAVQAELQAALALLPRWESERRERIRELNREVTRAAVTHLLEGVRSRYLDLPAVLEHLQAVEADLIENARELLSQPNTENPLEAGVKQVLQVSGVLDRYRVNVLVDHSVNGGAPVIEEDYPSLQNLVGRIEYRAQFGNLVTDFTMIRAGALHRANGGYLVLDARHVLQQAYSWEELKRCLRTRQVQVRSLNDVMGLSGAATPQPAPIPLEVKVVLVGDRALHALLSALDPDFLELFKVTADFEDALPRSATVELEFARLLAGIVRREGLQPLERGALERVIEFASRLAGDSERVSTTLETVADLIREANHWATEAAHPLTQRADIEQALIERQRRSSRLEERLRDEITRGTILVRPTGTMVGQVNGLSVIEQSGYSFGRPNRITARTRLGKGEIVDIEREAQLGGPLHSKGVMILSNLLAARFARERPLSLHASLVFEQSYGGIEGDSASLAEVCAILSSLAEIPIRQGLAITGSVNQHGEVQAIGGVNEKIEGFFALCQALGLSGDQGVIVPETNVKHLMLHQDVRDAVARGEFHLFAVRTVDEAIALLTGCEAGEPDMAGHYPTGTVNAGVEATLMRFADAARAFAEPRAARASRHRLSAKAGLREHPNRG